MDLRGAKTNLFGPNLAKSRIRSNLAAKYSIKKSENLKIGPNVPMTERLAENVAHRHWPNGPIMGFGPKNWPKSKRPKNGLIGGIQKWDG